MFFKWNYFYIELSGAGAGVIAGLITLAPVPAKKHSSGSSSETLKNINFQLVFSLNTINGSTSTRSSWELKVKNEKLLKGLICQDP